VFKLRTLVAFVLIATARVAAAGPGTFAITNARIVPVSGPVIEQGTVVIRDGLIAAVGGGVTVPADAWVVDGKGLTVYPGLIDALTDLGLPAAATPAPGGGRPGAAAPGGPAAPATPPARGPRDRPASTPWVQAADELKVDEKRFESWRNAGFTTALTAPKTGMFPGQGAVINLAGGRPGDLIVSAPASLQLSLQPPGGFGGFPSSLMGSVAYVRQVYLDVQHDADVRKSYDASPAGKERPAYDRTIRVLAEAQGANRPVFIQATTPTQIARVFALADEVKIKPVVYGLQEGFRSIDAIAAHKTPVIVSLRWPEKDSDGDPEAEEVLRTLRLRDKAPATPGLLQKAGVKFAFYSDGAAPRDLLKNARKAVDAGLPADAAVRALTLDAADILGVANRLGSIETGKIANLTITDGDLFNEKTKVKLVFVDGEKFDVRDTPPPARPGGEGNGQARPTSTAATLTGKWTLTVTLSTGVYTNTADLTMAEDGRVSGSIAGDSANGNVTGGSLTGSNFSFTANLATGAGPLNATFTGTIEGNSIKGSFNAGEFRGDFTGTRPGRAAAGDSELESGSESASGEGARS
jgi:imidazolonepropionase-like amidohydrolase